jgi:hypothetical protein
MGFEALAREAVTEDDRRVRADTIRQVKRAGDELALVAEVMGSLHGRPSSRQKQLPTGTVEL